MLYLVDLKTTAKENCVFGELKGSKKVLAAIRRFVFGFPEEEAGLGVSSVSESAKASECLVFIH